MTRRILGALLLVLWIATLAGGAVDADAKARKHAKKRARPAPAAVEKTEPSPAPETKPIPEPRPILIDISGDKSIYRVGDPIEMRVSADQDCGLTLIAIETSGLATVLFPNAFEPEGRLKAGVEIRIPKPGAGYRVRTDTPGTETVIAICNAVADRPLGVGYDFERQPFTILGDWSKFNQSLGEREREVQEFIADENRRRRREGRGAKIESPPPKPGEAEGRAILLLPVEADLPAEPAPPQATP